MTRERATHLFRIDLISGRIFWRNPPKNHPRLRGMEAGCLTSGKVRYWAIKADGRRWKRAVLIFLMKNHRLPRSLLDHKNRISTDDRPGNIREANFHQNAWNHEPMLRDLPRGIRLLPSGNFQARIACHGLKIAIGTYPTLAKATRAYVEKRNAAFGEFA